VRLADNTKKECLKNHTELTITQLIFPLKKGEDDKAGVITAQF